MPGLYVLLLVTVLGCLALIDKRYELVFFKNRRLAATIIAVCIALFIMWDIAGIALDIFYIGQTNLLLGLKLYDFPIEELFFLALLNYTPLIISQYLKLQRGIQ